MANAVESARLAPTWRRERDPGQDGVIPVWRGRGHARALSRRAAGLQALTAPVVDFLTRSTWAQRQGDPDIADFVVGNPHEPPLPDFVSALREQLEPRRDDWFAYQMNDPTACAAVAEGLRSRLGLAFATEDVLLTTGAFAGLSVALRTLIDPGDEVLFISPPWFFYEALIAVEGGVPVRVRVRPPAFDLDVAAIAQAITARTRAVIVNSPNNPTGRIYSPRELKALAAVLEDASRGRTGVGSICSRTRRTAASSFAASVSGVRPRTTPGRSSSIRTARRC